MGVKELIGEYISRGLEDLKKRRLQEDKLQDRLYRIKINGTAKFLLANGDDYVEMVGKVIDTDFSSGKVIIEVSSEKEKKGKKVYSVSPGFVTQYRFFESNGVAEKNPFDW